MAKFAKYLLIGMFFLLSFTDDSYGLLITDPTGDVSIGNSTEATPDIVSVEATFDTQNLYFRTSFAPGTFDINDYRFVLFLDIDQNPFTGISPVAIGGTVRTDIGLDFDVRGESSDPGGGFGILGTANIFQPFVGVTNSIPINFGTDSFFLTLPLAFIGNDDGLLNYVFAVGDSIVNGFVRNFDIAPNTGLGVSTPVPEPSTMLLLSSGLLGFGAFRKKLLK